MVASTEIKKRRVMERDHDEIASWICEEKQTRAGSEWRKKHEERWKEVDRQIAMDPPMVVEKSGEPSDPGDWHNAIQLGDLTDASETLTADILRLIFPTDRKWFTPHVELPTDIDDEGNPIPVEPERQRRADGVLRNFMVQQQKDFGFRGRIKLAIKEILHHGSVVMTVDYQRMRKFSGGTKPVHLMAPMPTVHSMWNAFPDPSPTIHGTEIFYTGGMILRHWMKLADALEMKDWINKKKLRAAYKSAEEKDHIEILTYYGDIFFKRHDGNVLFPNRKTIVSENVFLFSEVVGTDYLPVIYSGYERDDVRDPYYTSPIVKRSPMAKFATHMANKTMDGVDLKNKPPVSYDSQDNSMKGRGPEIYPGAKIGSRGGQGVQVLDVGQPEIGFAAMQWAKGEIQEGTATDSVRKGVSAGTEQTATEVVKTEQRAEVRGVEVVASLEGGVLTPYLIMQHDLNKKKMAPYPFFNDELHTPDFLTATSKELPDAVIMEVTGSRMLLGEEQRTARFINTVGIVSQLEPIAARTDLDEVARQLWEDTRVKDPERFLRAGDRNEELNQALEAQKAQFEELSQQMQAQMQQLQGEVQKAADAQRSAEVKAQEEQLQGERQKIQIERLQLEKTALQQQMRLAEEMERDESRLESLQQDIREREIKMQCKVDEGRQKQERDDKILSRVDKLLQ